jgi:ubiquinone/menaquinone biosynthesis C-methylase UbiE
VASAAVARYPRLHALGADARHLPFADGSFGAVVSTSTLDHFQAPDDIVKSLREIHRVLRTGGCLLLTLDNGANPAVALRNAAPFRLLNCLGLVPYYVGTTYGPRCARRALEQAGFAVLEVDGIMHCPRACAVAVAWQLQRHGGARMQRIFLRTLMACELLAQWPTQFLSGYFVALRAVRH